MAMSSAPLLPEVQAFVDTVRGLCAEGRKGEALWTAVADPLRKLLAEPALKEHTKSWPDTKHGDGAPGNLLFYEDPDYGFVLNALVKAPHSTTNIHDHGQSWTLYGVLEGGEHIDRYVRTDGGAPGHEPATLAKDGAFDVTPGYIDVVPPWQIHQEKNGDERTIGFIVRSQRSGTFTQYRFDTASGSVTSYDGPRQIPFTLA